METWNLESSGPSIPTSSNYFTSILPPPATAQNEEIRMKDMDRTSGNNGVEVVQSDRDHIRHGESSIKCIGSVEERRDYHVEGRAFS